MSETRIEMFRLRKLRKAFKERKRLHLKRKDPIWLESERERCRKYNKGRIRDPEQQRAAKRRFYLKNKRKVLAENAERLKHYRNDQVWREMERESQVRYYYKKKFSNSKLIDTSLLIYKLKKKVRNHEQAESHDQ